MRRYYQYEFTQKFANKRESLYLLQRLKAPKRNCEQGDRQINYIELYCTKIGYSMVYHFISCIREIHQIRLCLTMLCAQVATNLDYVDVCGHLLSSARLF